MAESVTVQFRKIFVEDLATSATANGATTATIMGIGDNVAVHAFISAASDAGAAGLGAALGAVYYNTTDGMLHARLA